MKSNKYQEVVNVHYSECTVEEIVDFVFNEIQPIGESKESTISYLKSDHGNASVMRPDIDETGIVYSAVIWKNRYDPFFTVKYITDYYKSYLENMVPRTEK